MSGRNGRHEQMIRCATFPLVAAWIVAWTSPSAAQTRPQDDGPPSVEAPVDQPPPAPSAEMAPPIASDPPAPVEFPGVTQGGIVSAPPNPNLRPWPTQRHFALVATEGSFNGFGLGVRAGSLRFGVDATFSFSPVFATFTTNPEKFPEFKLLTGFQGNASIYLGLHRLDARTDLGIAFGYKYSTLLRHGGTVAFYFLRELGAKWALMVFVGPCIFPDAEDQIRKETGWAGGSVSSGLAWHQAGIGASIAFFP